MMRQLQNKNINNKKKEILDSPRSVAYARLSTTDETHGYDID